MAANVLNNDRAAAMSVYVVRAFVKLREVLAEKQRVGGEARQVRTTIDWPSRSSGESNFEVVCADQSARQSAVAGSNETAHRILASLDRQRRCCRS